MVPTQNAPKSKTPRLGGRAQVPIVQPRPSLTQGPAVGSPSLTSGLGPNTQNPTPPRLGGRAQVLIEQPRPSLTQGLAVRPPSLMSGLGHNTQNPTPPRLGGRAQVPIVQPRPSLTQGPAVGSPSLTSGLGPNTQNPTPPRLGGRAQVLIEQPRPSLTQGLAVPIVQPRPSLTQGPAVGSPSLTSGLGPNTQNPTPPRLGGRAQVLIEQPRPSLTQGLAVRPPSLTSGLGPYTQNPTPPRSVRPPRLPPSFAEAVNGTTKAPSPPPMAPTNSPNQSFAPDWCQPATRQMILAANSAVKEDNSEISKQHKKRNRSPQKSPSKDTYRRQGLLKNRGITEFVHDLRPNQASYRPPPVQFSEIQRHPNPRNILTSAEYTRNLLDSGQFRNLSTPQRTYLGHLFTDSSKIASVANTKGTSATENRAWSYFQTFLQAVGLGYDPFLDSLDDIMRTRVVGTFACCYREGGFLQIHKRIRLPGCGNMRVHRQSCGKGLCGDQPTQPNPRQQWQNPPLSTAALQRLQELRPRRETPTGHSFCSPHGDLQHVSTIAGLRNFPGLSDFGRLFLLPQLRARRTQDKTTQETKRVLHKEQQIPRAYWPTDPDLENADYVSTQFEWQKCNIRDDIITQQSNGDPTFNPVKIAAKIVKRMIEMGRSENDLISHYRNKPGSAKLATSSKMAIQFLRTGVAKQDYEALGLKLDQIGLHSLRSSGAMAMYPNNIPVYTIMLLGRWSSDAFLRYIRKQVQQFSNQVSSRMIQNPLYHHVQIPNQDDPRTHNPLAATAISKWATTASTTSAPSAFGNRILALIHIPNSAPIH